MKRYYRHAGGRGTCLPTSALPNRRQAHAFTLVEMLVTTAVLTTLMLLLFSFFDQAAKAWNRSEQRIDAYREVRAAFYYLKRDLSTMIVSDQLPWVHLDDPSGAGEPLVNGAISGNPASAAQGNALFFLSAQPADAQFTGAGSDLCAVGYYLAWSSDPIPWGSGNNSYKLHRYFYNSDETWSNGLLDFLQGTNPWLFPTPVGAANGDEVIARNVVNFEIIPYRNNNGTLEAPPSGTNWQDWTEGGPHRKPDLVEVSLLAFNSDTAIKLGGNQSAWHVDSEDPGASGVLQGQNAQVFHMRVPVK